MVLFKIQSHVLTYDYGGSGMYTFHRFRPCVHTLAPRAGDKRSVHWSCSPHGPGLISVSGHKREKKCLESNYTHKHTWVEVSSLCQWVWESEPFSHQDLSIHYSVLGKFSGLLSITSPWWNRHSWPNTLLFYKGSKVRPTQGCLFVPKPNVYSSCSSVENPLRKGYIS